MSKSNLFAITILWVSFASSAPLWAQSLTIDYSGVILDNDDHRDTYTEEMLMIAEHVGALDLKAIITTYQHSEYPEFVEVRKAIRKKAEQSGLKVDYRLFSGTNKTLSVPPSGKIEDTQSLDIEGSHFIVSEAQQASSQRPLAILTGGQLTSVANAYLLDSTVADRIVVLGVFGAPTIDYNASLDAWAWTIILAKMKVVSFKFREDNGDFGQAFLQRPSVPRDRLKDVLPSNAFTQWMIDKHHPRQEIFQEDWDGTPLATLLSDQYVTRYQRWFFQKIDPDNHHPVMKLDPEGKVYEILDADKEVGTEAYWEILTAYGREE